MESKKIVLLVARDNAPSIALGFLGERLEKEGYGVVVHLGYGKPLQRNLQDLLYWISSIRYGDNMVITGMSSSPELADPEISVLRRVEELGKPSAVYADIFGVVNRPWFQGLNPSLVFVINQSEAEKAKKAFPSSKVVVSGNPCWEKFAFPESSREQARQVLGVKEDEKVILCPLCKAEELILNVLLLGALVDAIEIVERRIDAKVVVFVALHPGDIEENRKHYELILGSNPGIRIEILPKGIKTSSIMPGIDLMFTLPGSNSGIEAAYQRIPVICYCDSTTMGHLWLITGDKEWYPCTVGASMASRPGHPVLDIAHCLDPRSGTFQQMKARQEKVFPVPTRRGETLDKMVAAIKELLQS